MVQSQSLNALLTTLRRLLAAGAAVPLAPTTGHCTVQDRASQSDDPDWAHSRVQILDDVLQASKATSDVRGPTIGKSTIRNMNPVRVGHWLIDWEPCKKTIRINRDAAPESPDTTGFSAIDPSDLDEDIVWIGNDVGDAIYQSAILRFEIARRKLVPGNKGLFGNISLQDSAVIHGHHSSFDHFSPGPVGMLANSAHVRGITNNAITLAKPIHPRPSCPGLRNPRQSGSLADHRQHGAGLDLDQAHRGRRRAEFTQSRRQGPGCQRHALAHSEAMGAAISTWRTLVPAA